MELIVATLLLTTTAQATYNHYSPAVTFKDYLAAHSGETKIIHGEPASAGQFPWQAGVHMQLPSGRAFCGGSLIDPEWVLTAAHCADGVISWTISLGALQINVPNEPGSVSVVSSKGIHHKDYNDNLNNDIALIRLPEKVPLSNTIQTIRLPAKSEVDDRLENVNVTVSGWGKTSDASKKISPVLNYVQLTTITNSKCALIYGPMVVIDSTVCAVGNPDHSTCNGDSGGPLIRFGADGLPTQVGVVSFVHTNGCGSGNPSGYVRTASFLDWINQKTGILIHN